MKTWPGAVSAVQASRQSLFWGFITCCEDDGLEGLDHGAVFHVHGGELV